MNKIYEQISMTEPELYLIAKSIIEHCVGNDDVRTTFAASLVERLSFNLSNDSLQLLSDRLLDIEAADILAKKAADYFNVTKGGYPDPTNHPDGWPMGYGMNKSIWIELMDSLKYKVVANKRAEESNHE